MQIVMGGDFNCALAPLDILTMFWIKLAELQLREKR